MGLRSVVARRPFSVMLVAMLIYTLLFGLQFMWFVQVQENYITKRDCGGSTDTMKGEAPKQDRLKEVLAPRVNFTEGTPLHNKNKHNNTFTHKNSNSTSTHNTSNLELGLEKVDWNDYEFYARERIRKGLGEQGKPAVLRPQGVKKKLSTELFKEYMYNAYASDQISVERASGDTRTAACKVQKFIKNIPENSVSVIIVFYNERKSMLLRTVHSVVNRSPANLLKEVILVDDLSDKNELKVPLDVYIMKHFNKVKVIRNSRRLGLIRSRIAGADASTGTFLVFFDAHIEVNSNYLPPLLEPMVFNYRTITCPMVDAIQVNKLEISPLRERIRGAFDWGLVYKRLPVEPGMEMDETTPHPSPVMVGCAFAITRKWWEEFDKYDLGLQIWGGEQYEMSFKSWMCGGSVVDAPCSRVAHLFRSLPYVAEVTKDDRVESNFLRVASVWMDDYKKYVVQRRPRMKGLDPGDLKKQFDLKKRLNCKSFDWYLNNVAPDLLVHYPPVNPPDIAWGYVRSGYRKSLCLMNEDDKIVVRRCGMEAKYSFTLDWRNHVYFGNKCWANPGGRFIFPWECLDIEKNKTQLFAWNRNHGQIINVHTHLCLDCDFPKGQVFMAACDLTKKTQFWKFDNYDETQADAQWEKYKAILDN